MVDGSCNPAWYNQSKKYRKRVIGSDTLIHAIQPKYWLRLQAKQTEPMLKIMCSYMVTSTASATLHYSGQYVLHFDLLSLVLIVFMLLLSIGCVDIESITLMQLM